MRLFPLAILLVTLALLQCPSTLAGTPPNAFPFKPGELIVKLKNDPGIQSKIAFSGLARSIQELIQTNAPVTVRSLVTSSQYAVIKFSETDRSKVSLALRTNSQVEYAEPNYIYHTLTPKDLIPNDPSFSSLWGMKNTGQKSPAPNPSATPGQDGLADADVHVTSVWDEGIVGNKNIRVAVIDSGIDYTHPDLKENVNQSAGFNFVNQASPPLDDLGHGTHCAGTIGASGNNGVGVSGINWNVSLIPIKFIDVTGSGTADAALQAIQYATKIGVNIMSNSWGGGGFSQALFDAISAAKSKGILFVVASGNSAGDNDAVPSYPASYALDNILAVGATDNRDQFAGFSNFGRTSVHVSAPGVNILSTFLKGGYEVLSGTSMATPHVAGIAALVLGANPSFTYSQLKDAIVQSCDPVRSLARKAVCGGRVNAYNAVHGIHPIAFVPPESEWKDVAISIQTPHPYENSHPYSFPIQIPNAKYIRVIFDTFSTEAGYDFVHLTQANGDEIETLSGSHPNYVSNYLIGDHAVVSLTNDSTINNTGFSISRVQAIY